LPDPVISPEPFILKCKSLAKAKNPYLEVVKGRVRLAWSNSENLDFMERSDVIGLGISYDIMFEALSEAGGETTLSGCYPINNAIRQKLRKLLWTD